MKIPIRVKIEGGGWIDCDAGAKPVEIGDRLVPPAVSAVFPSDGVRPGLELDLEVVDGVPQCRRCSIVAVPGGRDVRLSDLQHIRLDHLVRRLFALAPTTAVITERGDGAISAVVRTDPTAVDGTEQAVQLARSESRRAIDRPFLERVAKVYRDHLEDRPVAAVQQHFNVEYRTAAGYVQRARRSKPPILPPTTAGKRRA